MSVSYLTNFTHSLCAVPNFQDIGPPEYEGKMVQIVRLLVWLKCMCIYECHFLPPTPNACKHEKTQDKVCILFTWNRRSCKHKSAHPVLVNMCVHACHEWDKWDHQNCYPLHRTAHKRWGFEKHGGKLSRRVVGSHACSENSKIHVQDATDDVQIGPSVCQWSLPQVCETCGSLKPVLILRRYWKWKDTLGTSVHQG